MWYFLCLSGGLIAGFILAAVMTAGKVADLVTRAGAANQRAASLDKANLVLRRELAELRAAHEAPRNHGYGASNG
jgi:hypothetical protein